jgi:hypothetical protein
MATEPTCRFCFDEELNPRDPLLAPCACAGSMRYIHRDCLRRWQATTENQQFREWCCVCKGPYMVPRRYPLELLPDYNHYNLYYLINSRFAMIVIVHYLHIIAISHTVPMPRGFEDADHALAIRLHTSKALNLYYLLLAIISIPYGFFLFSFMKHVVNRQLYTFYAPIYFVRYVAGAVMCLFLVQYSVFPFGGLYISLLPCLFLAHTETIRRINMEGTVL